MEEKKKRNVALKFVKFEKHYDEDFLGPVSGINVKTVIIQTKTTIEKNLTNLILGNETRRPTGHTDQEAPR